MTSKFLDKIVGLAMNGLADEDTLASRDHTVKPHPQTNPGPSLSEQNKDLLIWKFLPYQISQLEYLKALNIRSLPARKADAATSEVVAMDVANALLQYGSRLETLGLGSTTWTVVWQGR